MNKKEYLAKREASLAEIKALMDEGKIDEANAKMDEVKALDFQWEQTAKAQANLNALKDNPVGIDIVDKNVKPDGTVRVVEKIFDEVKLDDSALYETAWAKHLQGKALAESERAIFDKMNAGIRNDGYTHTTIGVPTLIPNTVVAGIWKRAEEMYPLLGDVRKYNVRGTLTINKHTGITQGDAAFYDEGTATVDEKNVFGQLVLSGCELSKVVTVSWKMRSMSVEDFIPFIKNELGERVGVALGTAIAKGKGKPGASESNPWPAEPEGVETALLAENDTPQVVTYNPDASTPDPLTYEKLTTAISKIHSSYLNSCAIYANNATIWTQLANLTDVNGRALFIPDLTSGGVGRMFGMTVKADAGLSAGNVLIGDAGRGYVMNTNEPMSLAQEEHVKARTVDYAAYAIVDGGVLDTKAFALVKKSS